MKYLKLYVISFITFFLVDLVWLVVVAKDFYKNHIGQFMAPMPNWGGAVIFYALYIAGILVFVILPSLEKKSLKKATVLGGFFGLVCYATFDLTCYATFEDFPLLVVVIDLIWGTVLTMIISVVGFLFGRKYLK